VSPSQANCIQPGQPPARQVLITQPDARPPGGLEVVQTLFASSLGQTCRAS
jgi:hypothetical protein